MTEVSDYQGFEETSYQTIRTVEGLHN